ncbi:hypothetical protein, partial [Gallibacterium anatis]
DGSEVTAVSKDPAGNSSETVTEDVPVEAVIPKASIELVLRSGEFDWVREGCKGPLTYEVSLDRVADQDITIPVTLDSVDRHQAGANLSVTILKGQLSARFTVTPKVDSIEQGDQNVNATISEGTGYTVDSSNQTATGVIRDAKGFTDTSISEDVTTTPNSEGQSTSDCADVIKFDTMDNKNGSVTVNTYGGDDYFIGNALNNAGNYWSAGSALGGNNAYHNRVNMGDGNDTVDVGLLTNINQSFKDTYNIIDLGAGNDKANIDNMMYSNAILSASGNNTISVRAMSGTNLIATGTGDDVVTIGSAFSNSQIAYPLNKGILLDEQVRTILSESQISDYENQTKALVHLGEGNNKLTVTGLSTGIDYEMGAGNDTVSVNQLLRSSVTTGAGDDSVVIKDWIGGHVLEGTPQRSGVDLGAGNDTITVGGQNITNMTAANATITSNQSVVDGGDGYDRFNAGDSVKINLFNIPSAPTSRYPNAYEGITLYDIEEVNLTGSNNVVFVSGRADAMADNINKVVYVYESTGSSNRVNFMNNNVTEYTRWTKGALETHTIDGVQQNFYKYTSNTGGTVFVEDSINVTTSGYYI